MPWLNITNSGRNNLTSLINTILVGHYDALAGIIHHFQITLVSKSCKGNEIVAYLKGWGGRWKGYSLYTA